MWYRFEFPLNLYEKYKFFDDFREFTTAIRSPDKNPVGIIITEDQESVTFVKLKLSGIKNITYQEMK
jgi:hypothetical protein